MIVSFEHKFVFVKGRKVASTSVELALSQVVGPSDIVTPITPIDEKYRLEKFGKVAQNFGCKPNLLNEYIDQLRKTSNKALANLNIPKGKFYNHMSLQELTEAKVIEPADYTLVYLTRSPYQKIISLANMRCAFKYYESTGQRMQTSLPFIIREVERLIVSGEALIVNNMNLYSGKQLFKKVIKISFENLHEELSKFLMPMADLDRLQLPHAKMGLKSENLNVKQIFSNRQISWINKNFKNEFQDGQHEMILI